MMAPPMSVPACVEIHGLVHDYGERRVLSGLDVSVRQGEIFGLLGPNGGGKTTLFRILATLMRPTGGRALVLGHDVAREANEVRRLIGVVFQSPALDRKLTVRENLLVQGRLYGLGARQIRQASDDMLRRVRLLDRAEDRVERLSGGLMRRAEIAKGLLHRPRLLLMDEPSSGLDPGARQDLWELLRELRGRDATTILLTTHLMEEAERCDRLAILSEGALVAEGAPRDLKKEIGGDVIVITTTSPGEVRDGIERRFGGPVRVVDGTVRLERPSGHELIPRIVEAFADRIDSVTLGRPTLLDVFIHKTGHRFFEDEAA
ncbi:MAG: ABC transporter ATP-binding protein [Acidobacteria bacterium 13_1_40CM_2_68_10]|nr:MAG: ABC transporter ATP-binding protein [Acidobacteria bacterium 13_1_40CM_2_68_10]OLE65583.1 MAG: ABC transporter ATP-binding protein [Acidobacteria bacterium 13_1_20CM_2_68_14]